MLEQLNAIREEHAGRVRLLRNMLEGAIPPPNARQILGEIGGEARRYRHRVILTLTEWAAQHSADPDLTKFRVQGWQKTVFGCSVSNSVAVKWCRPGRQCGERGALEVPDPVSSLCSLIYLIYRTVPDKALNTSKRQTTLQRLIDQTAAAAGSETSLRTGAGT